MTPANSRTDTLDLFFGHAVTTNLPLALRREGYHLFVIRFNPQGRSLSHGIATHPVYSSRNGSSDRTKNQCQPEHMAIHKADVGLAVV